ncbi:serine/threonine-protein phosphatase PGAM5, mitochondrial isoform X3 [Canis lupus baileyi]|uniref:serine/threonine-protein phosphatase PGAM5, mitochondrial isoform X3 n=1 Tax=Canis lupus dingo TaxID=286419 RepID=UPI0015F1B0E0|nr:serine/threonine-protein phosphatase PGAM5, mitochondrial isoform X3 [Canis lupus dingo]XP_038292183.1 serine/threonine-protein phosphatase PGAM5, mitochondrial isoform X3 [Canis lupus familiaris]XP_038315356.1 serine/threonine-protein phosphatase PGAM5, mitochondrial isoform X3 [Canis lupus familiaris]XP_038430559.1 serine/threonine-protein phosphatase PGAM5, mitochondrial isoform X3 [Canis lupus familiaris]
MAFRQALQLAACGLAGGSAAVLFSAVAVGKPRAGGDAEPRVVEAPAWAGTARPGPGVWDPNWDRLFGNLKVRLLLVVCFLSDGSALESGSGHCGMVHPIPTPYYFTLNEGHRTSIYCQPRFIRNCIEITRTRLSYFNIRREPLSLVNLRKRNLDSGEEELASRLDHCKAKATRHIFLIRHSQYHMDASLEKDRTLTPLGREQAELTGLRLASLGLKFNKIVHSSMTRAIETSDIISKHLPGVCKVSTDLLREGAPIEPDPPVSHWKPEAVIPCSAPSSIMKMEPGLRPPSGTTSIGQMSSSRKTVTRSSSAMPMSSATSCAGHCSSLLKAGSACLSTMAA